MILNQVLHGDALTKLKLLKDGSVNCCVTSTPYWNLRDYDVDGQIGLEDTPEEFILRLVDVFREVKRVLNDNGTLWLNIGDSYASQGKNRTPEQAKRKSNLNGSTESQEQSLIQKSKITGDLKAKDLVGIPWMLAFALRADGWYLRQDIIWSKPNPMPESVTDRCTKSHEYIFLLSKSPKYYYDAEAIRKLPADSSIKRLSQNLDNQNGSDRVPNKTNGNMKAVMRGDKERGSKTPNTGFNKKWDLMTLAEQQSMGANKRSVWECATKPFSEAHFATFPPELIIDCIKAGCPIDGIVLDPFFGAGTTGLVARKLNRNFIGIELNEKYINEIALPRLEKELGMFA